MLNLLYAFKRLLRDRGLLRKMSLLFGASTETVEATTDTVGPALVGRLAQIGDTPNGAAEIGELIDAADPTSLSSASDFLERGNDDNDRLLTRLFGDDRTQFVSELASRAGVGVGTVSALLPKLAAMFMGYLAKYRNDNDASPTEMVELLHKERTELGRTESGDELLGLGTGLAAGAVGAAGVGAAMGAGSSQESVAQFDADETADFDVDDATPDPPESAQAGVDPKSAAAVAAAAAAATGAAAVNRGSSDQSAAEVSATERQPEVRETAPVERAATTNTRQPTATVADDDGNKRWLGLMAGLLALFVLLALLLSQCGSSDSDDETASATTLPPATTAAPAPTTVAPTTVAPTTAAPTTTQAPTTTVPPTTTPPTTLPPEPEPADAGEPLAEGLLAGGFTLANSIGLEGNEPVEDITAEAATSTGVEFAPFGPFEVDVAADEITMAWSDDPQFDDLERTLEDGFTDRYMFTFDEPVFSGLTASADESQNLVPEVDIVDDNNLVVDFTTGMTVGDGQVAVIQFDDAAMEETMAELPATGVESIHLAAVGVIFMLLGVAMVGGARRFEVRTVLIS